MLSTFQKWTLDGSKVDRQKILNFLPNDFNKIAMIPKTKFIEVFREDINTNIDGISGFNAREFNMQRSNINRMIVINEAITAQSKNVTRA